MGVHYCNLLPKLKVSCDTNNYCCLGTQQANISGLRIMSDWIKSVPKLVFKLKQTRISEHTDFGMVTLLFQDSIGGLEVADHDHQGEFMSVEPDSKVEILANVGDSLERLTNGYLKSINHRVTIPASLMNSPDGMLKERYSIAYFGKAERERSLKPLTSFVKDGTPAKYDDITAYQWNQIKLGLSYN